MDLVLRLCERKFDRLCSWRGSLCDLWWPWPVTPPERLQNERVTSSGIWACFASNHPGGQLVCESIIGAR